MSGRSMSMSWSDVLGGLICFACLVTWALWMRPGEATAQHVATHQRPSPDFCSVAYLVKTTESIVCVGTRREVTEYKNGKAINGLVCTVVPSKWSTILECQAAADVRWVKAGRDVAYRLHVPGIDDSQWMLKVWIHENGDDNDKRQ